MIILTFTSWRSNASLDCPGKILYCFHIKIRFFYIFSP